MLGQATGGNDKCLRSDRIAEIARVTQKLLSEKQFSNVDKKREKRLGSKETSSPFVNFYFSPRFLLHPFVCHFPFWSTVLLAQNHLPVNLFHLALSNNRLRLYVFFIYVLPWGGTPFSPTDYQDPKSKTKAMWAKTRVCTLNPPPFSPLPPFFPNGIRPFFQTLLGVLNILHHRSENPRYVRMGWEVRLLEIASQN